MTRKTKRQFMRRRRGGLTAPFHGISLNILGFQEDKQWVALALEMDLRGYGTTPKQAIRDLRDLVRMQIGFAVFKRQPQMIFKPAEPIYFQLFAQTRQQRFFSIAIESAEEHAEYQIGSMPIPPPMLSRDPKRFSLVDE